MNRLNKTRLKERDELVEKLRKAGTRLEEAIDQFNRDLDFAFGKVEKAIENYNNAVSIVGSYKDDLVSEMQSFYDEKSDKWKEGDRGEAYYNWQQEWEGIDTDEVAIDPPGGLELPDLALADALDATPEEPS